ncbi:MAG TPA: DUF1707 domain-containing protein [Streptosporangiaceae bacterium]|nr:DUF1707 domain-containing protein [Streptosporangiaceae bacterium]
MSGSAPGGPRRLAGEADREQLVALLREHYALGQLDEGELDRRVGAVLSARYMDEAASAVADLPQLAAPGSAAGRPSGRRRGHAEAARPAAGWIPTDERFRDPTTRAVMRVWIDPADQSRHYIPEPDA